jgi:hypothetical protein
MSESTVTVGVPVYRGELYLEEALESLRSQSHRDFEAILSVDGPDPASEALCRRFLTDSRFRIVVQPQRLGWVGNLNWLMAQVETPFWCYHQQDDLLDRRYLEVLVGAAREMPAAAVVFGDIEAFGALSMTFAQASVTGSAAARELALLYEHLPAVAFRGVTRIEALRLGGGIPANEIDSFACDTAWMAAMARWGELRRVPGTIAHKRFHSAGEHTKWAQWPLEKRTRAWVVHCGAMLEQAMLVDATSQERRLLWLAAVGRLVSVRTAIGYLPVKEFTSADRAPLLDAFFEHVRGVGTVDVPGLLEAGWPEIEEWTRGFYRRAP